jgi:5-histidylcysteine sulfoxide synthase/putative 4-mercaptohistidine N1-methyltranferase
MPLPSPLFSEQISLPKLSDLMPLMDQDLLKVRTIFLNEGDPEAKRQEILNYFHQTFSLYEKLFECLLDENTFYFRPNPLRQPLIFYYGHTSVFFINKLNITGHINERVDPLLESLLAIGVDEMSWDDLNETRTDWPSQQRVKDHRDATRNIVDHFIKTCPISFPIGWEDPLWIVMMGIEHERIHLETSAVLIRELPIEQVKPHPFWSNICKEIGPAPQNELLPVYGPTQIKLGKTRNNPFYGWDNEYGYQHHTVNSFSASQYLVSNQEYLAFVEADGYLKRKYWSEEGWNWVVYKQATQPACWIQKGTEYFYRTMLEEIEMPWNWPVDVNYLEAKAFCNWKSEETGRRLRLPTEAEWRVLRQSIAHLDQPTWDHAPGNLNLEYYASACPVDQFRFPGGFYDIIGNGWQWTETPIDGFEGFQVHPAYDDFSVPTFDGKHNIFKGGCWISTGNYAIQDSRYAFRRHFLQHSTIRYVEGDDLVLTEPNVYETDQMVSQYIEFHYGDIYFNVPNFPKQCADLCIEYMKDHKKEKALDLGCATGRSSYELARAFDHVDALDFSARLIQMPTQLQKNGHQRYVIQDEGELVSYKEILASDLALEPVLHKVHFTQGDACNLLAKYTGYDLIFAGNLIDRLYEPAEFLNSIHQRLEPQGFLILTSPYTWLNEFTQRDHWVGGFKATTGENYTTLDGLKDILAPHFNFIANQDVPFVIRETRRKFQHTVSEMTVWQRKS